MPDSGHREPAQGAQWDQVEAAPRDVLASMAGGPAWRDQLGTLVRGWGEPYEVATV